MAAGGNRRTSLRLALWRLTARYWADQRSKDGQHRAERHFRAKGRQRLGQVASSRSNWHQRFPQNFFYILPSSFQCTSSSLPPTRSPPGRSHPSRRFRKSHTPSLLPLQLRTAPWFQRMRTRLERNELVVHALFLTQQLWRSAAGMRVFSPLRLGGGREVRRY